MEKIEWDPTSRQPIDVSKIGQERISIVEKDGVDNNGDSELLIVGLENATVLKELQIYAFCRVDFPELRQCNSLTQLTLTGCESDVSLSLPNSLYCLTLYDCRFPKIQLPEGLNYFTLGSSIVAEPIWLPSEMHHVQIDGSLGKLPEFSNFPKQLLQLYFINREGVVPVKFLSEFGLLKIGFLSLHGVQFLEDLTVESCKSLGVHNCAWDEGTEVNGNVRNLQSQSGSENNPDFSRHFGNLSVEEKVYLSGWSLDEQELLGFCEACEEVIVSYYRGKDFPDLSGTKVRSLTVVFLPEVSEILFSKLPTTLKRLDVGSKRNVDLTFAGQAGKKIVF